MVKVAICLLFLVGACGDDDPLQCDAAAAAADAALPAAADAALPPDAAAADAAPVDATVVCGGENEPCCRIDVPCAPAYGCVATGPGEGVCVLLVDAGLGPDAE